MEFIYPTKNYLTITQGYSSTHLGNDYGWTASKAKDAINQPIVAVESGKVVTAVDGYNNTYPSSRIYGNYIIIDHGGWWSVYAHLLKGSVAVKVGDKVAKGQTIARMGDTGFSRGTHLHFELRKNFNDRAHTVDPLDYLMVEGDSMVISSTTLYPQRIKKRSVGIGTTVPRDETKEQVEILVSCLRGRSFASVNADFLGYVKKGVFNVYDSAKAGDYTFFKIDKDSDLWCAFDESWAILYTPKELHDFTALNVSNGDLKTLAELCEKLKIKYTF